MNKQKEILLGDNPFFGIDHLSQEKARQRAEIMKGHDKITDIIEFASEFGVNGFVVSTHPQLKEIINYMKTKTNLLEKTMFYPIIPYVQGYVTRVTERGVVGAMNDILSGSTMQDKLKIFFKGSMGIMKKDFDKLLETLIDVELFPLDITKKKTIFLHDVVTDLAVSLGMKNIIETFISYIKDRHGTDAGLVTKNFPKLVETLRNWDLDIPVIMTSFNPIGYQMNPTKEECEKNLLKTNKVIAMNTLAGGYLAPLESAEYISKLDLMSVVIGMSNKEHVKETLTTFLRQ